MTQDEIIEMARQAGMEQDGNMWFSNIDMDVHISHLEAFAKLVAAKEREACAQIAYRWNFAITDMVAKEIRARGEQA
jgi:hypothetical protein